MAPLAVLARDVVETALKDLPGWGLDQDKLYREFVFEDFSQAFAFMSRVALAAETAPAAESPTSASPTARPLDTAAPRSASS